MQILSIRDVIPAASTKQVDMHDRSLSPYAEQYRWKFDAYHPALEALLPAVKHFVSDVIAGEEPYWLTILGPSGVGKTFLLRQCYQMLSRNEHIWPFRTFGKRGEIKSERFGTRAHIIPGEDLGDYKAPRDYGSYDLIYVEDIGAGAGVDRGAGAVTSSRVAELLQYRTGKWTLLDANMSRADIEQKIDPRIASRLKRDGSILIQLPGDVPDFNDRQRA